MQVLKKSDIELTPEVQAALNKVTVITPKEATKLMHGAVSKLDTARDRLQKARTARDNMHRNWSKFVADAVIRWQQHTERFEKEDAELQEAIEAASTAFQTARQHLEDTKEALAEFDDVIGQVQDVSDEELMSDAMPNIATNLQELMTSLRRLRDSQDDNNSAAAKKPRIEGPISIHDGEEGPAVPKAMQPFGAGGK